MLQAAAQNKKELKLLRDIGFHSTITAPLKIDGKTICPLGEAAAWPVASAVRHFRQEFEDHVKLQKCPLSK